MWIVSFKKKQYYENSAEKKNCFVFNYPKLISKIIASNTFTFCLKKHIVSMFHPKCLIAHMRASKLKCDVSKLQAK